MRGLNLLAKDTEGSVGVGPFVVMLRLDIWVCGTHGPVGSLTRKSALCSLNRTRKQDLMVYL